VVFLFYFYWFWDCCDSVVFWSIGMFCFSLYW
jgi:hypothetical protein